MRDVACDPTDDPAIAGDVRIVCAHPCRLGESPLWHPQRQQLFWIDIDARQVLAVDVDGAWPADGALPQIWTLPEQPGCIGLVARDADPADIDPDRLMIALRSGFFRLDLRDETLHRLSPPLYDAAAFRFNDGRVDPAGRFWAGTMVERKDRAAGGLYVFDRGASGPVTGPDVRDAERSGWGVTTSNGLAFSPDGRTAWQADTPAHTVYAHDFDPESGRLSNRRAWWRTGSDRDAPDYGGRPDGAAVDVDGRYWSAQWAGGRVVCLDAEGALAGHVAVPARNPTMVAFGGDDLCTMFITSAGGAQAGAAADGAQRDAASGDGRLMACRVQRPGLAPVGCVQASGAGLAVGG